MFSAGQQVQTSIYDCDFENGTSCGWSNDDDNDYNWKIGQGPTPTVDTGPAADHTTGTSIGEIKNSFNIWAWNLQFFGKFSSIF